MTHADPNKEATFRVCVIRSEMSEARYPREAIIREVERFGFSEDDIFALQLTIEEALSNAIKHGNKSDAGKTVTVRFAVDETKAVVIVADEGPGFAPDKLPDCTSPERLSAPNGRGVMLMRAYMDEVCYRNNGREVYFAKYRGGSARPSRKCGSGSESACRAASPGSGPDVTATRRTVHYRGRVQGVGFRATAASVAAGFSVVGFVKNLADGQVLLVVEGARAEVDRFLSALQHRMASFIRDSAAIESPATGEWTDFRIAY